jgi:competence ComEA-like helix-hairpin-helix protein
VGLRSSQLSAFSFRLEGALALILVLFSSFEGAAAPLLRFGSKPQPEVSAGYHGARHRLPMGRFASPDPEAIGLEDLSNPQNLNRYAYARGNPVGREDPDGRKSRASKVVAAVIVVYGYVSWKLWWDHENTNGQAFTIRDYISDADRRGYISRADLAEAKKDLEIQRKGIERMRAFVKYGGWLAPGFYESGASSVTKAERGLRRAEERLSRFPVYEPLNVNQASIEELAALPGMTPEVARAIVADRDRNGPFESREDLQAVRGLDREILERLAPLFFVEPR